MKRLALLGIPAALLLASVASAHFVTTPTCGHVVFDDTTKGWTALVEPGDLSFGPFVDGDNGPYAIAPGQYSYTFEDATGEAHETGSFEVAACDSAPPSAAPSRMPVPSRTEPRPTPPATASSTQPSDADPWSLFGLILGLTLISFGLLARRERQR